MKIDRVTMTGADDSTDRQDIYRLTEEYPFVEWGILLSERSVGSYRFPTHDWINTLVQGYEHRKHKPILSGHICGRWVREICKGNWQKFRKGIFTFDGYFSRFQLNFHSQTHKIKPERFIECLKGVGNGPFGHMQFIFQFDDVNNEILDVARDQGVDAVPLFDTSGGIGRLPDFWPEPRECYCGYAGGLSPDNLKDQLKKIEDVVGDRTIWIDAETHVRSDNDRVFDIQKVERFLQIAQEYM